eukprot:COSAG02_NODE_7072_length_3199_cov_528.647419_1_plen_53_part_10
MGVSRVTMFSMATSAAAVMACASAGGGGDALTRHSAAVVHNADPTSDADPPTQ